MLRTILFAALAFCLGALLGPILIAAGTSLGAPSGASERAVAAHQLLRTFDEHFPQPTPMASFVLGAVARDCGYDGDRLFGPEDNLAEGRNWTPLTGYFDLVMWLHEEFREETEDRRAQQLEQRLSKYELEFFRRCEAKRPSLICAARECGMFLRKVTSSAPIPCRPLSRDPTKCVEPKAFARTWMD